MRVGERSLRTTNQAFSDGAIQRNAQTDIVVRGADAKYKRYISLYKRKSI